MMKCRDRTLTYLEKLSSQLATRASPSRRLHSRTIMQVPEVLRRSVRPKPSSSPEHEFADHDPTGQATISTFSWKVKHVRGVVRKVSDDVHQAVPDGDF